MRRYRVVHRTEYHYGATMVDGYSVAHLLPRGTPSQEVHASEVISDPVGDEIDESIDAFGNRVLQLGIHQPHERLAVVGQSEVEVRQQELPRRPTAWERVVAQIDGLRGALVGDVLPFTASSRFVTVNEHRSLLGGVAAEAFLPNRPIVEACAALSTSIFERFVFDPSFTEVSTPLDDVIASGRGVCQDFAHLAVGAVRSLGLAARYVSGYIETDPPPGEPKVFGADASHAWCSVWVPDHGWLDIDPTNGIIAPDRHVTVGWGRDYADVAPVRGVVIGPSSTQQLTVSVDVSRV
ncbi:MAG: transglutaminase family protein [Actinomycetota bacterium]